MRQKLEKLLFYVISVTSADDFEYARSFSTVIIISEN